MREVNSPTTVTSAMRRVRAMAFLATRLFGDSSAMLMCVSIYLSGGILERRAARR